MKDLAIEYAEELKRGPALEGSRKHPLTVRVSDETLRLLEGLAQETGKKRAEVAADVMAGGAKNLALTFAKEMGWEHAQVRAFFEGDAE
jgi:predicted transcriptional regulator